MNRRDFGKVLGIGAAIAGLQSRLLIPAARYNEEVI